MKRYIDKETGEKKAFGNLQVYAEAENTNERQFLGNFDSFKQILEYYEDYTPKEPLIKDEQARKLVLAWAKLAQTTKILTVKRRTSIGAKFTEFFSQEKRISLEFLGRFDELEDGKEYDITELCWEEE